MFVCYNKMPVTSSFTGSVFPKSPRPGREARRTIRLTEIEEAIGRMPTFEDETQLQTAPN
jgi:hypothetical protein